MSQAVYDVIIVGAGPAGLSAAARSHHCGLNYLLLERGRLANTIQQYPLGKYVMALPHAIPLRSDLMFKAGRRETVLRRWEAYAAQQHLQIRTNTPVTAITRQDDDFEVKTRQETYKAKRVVLAIGTQGNMQSLNVPGEDRAHVLYQLYDPKAFSDKDILIVGAGDSAAESAIMLSVHNRVTLLNRKPELYKMNDALRRHIEQKVESKKMTVCFDAKLEQIEEDFATLCLPDRQARVKADLIVVNIGHQPARGFLKACGVTFASEAPKALPIIDAHYQTEVPGLFLIGSVGGRDLIKHAMNQGYEVIEYISSGRMTSPDEALLQERLQSIPRVSVEEKLEYIAQAVPILAPPVPPQRLRELVLESTVQCVESGRIIFREHDYSTDLYTIIQGRVELSFHVDPERTIGRTRRTQGEFFGEMSLIADRRRSATVTVLEPSILLSIPRRTVLKLLYTEPSVKRCIDEVYALRTFQTYLCPSLDPRAFHQVVRNAAIQTFEKDAVIFEDGEPGDAFYMVRSGSVKISKRSQEGKEYITAYRRVGEYFGETALLLHDVRRVTASAATRTEVIRIVKADFLAFVQAHPYLEKQIREQASKRNLERAMVLAAPKQELLDHFIQHGVLESTDVLLIDETKCIRCDNCVTACARTHNGQTRLERISGPSFAHLHVPVTCRHCEGAPCLQDCPPGDAIERAPNGVVQIYADKCIGCGNCAKNCPYDVIFMVEVPHKKTLWDRFNLLDLLPGRKQQATPGEDHQEVAIKCDLCTSININHDMVEPACVQSCPTGAAMRVQPDYFTQVKLC